DRRPVDGQACGLAHAPVVPGRLRIPLVEEVQPVDAVEQGGDELDAGRATQILGDRADEEIGEIDLAGLHGRRARALVGDATHDDSLDLRRLSPVLWERLERELAPGG